MRSGWLVAGSAALVLGVVGCSDVLTLEPPRVDAVEVVPPEQSYVYDADGNELAILRQEYRESVAFERMPQHLIDAVVAAEDRRFWTHAGVDARAIARAAAVNYATGRPAQGGSTITQQVVKNLFMPDAPRDMETKSREALLARDLERAWSKDEILERYLNTVYFGNGAYGVKAAAYTYWRKDVEELTLDEAALLSGLIRAPESGNPDRYPEAARARRDRVLDAMLEEGTVTPADAATARGRPIEVEPRPPVPAARQPHWVDHVVRILKQEPSFGEAEADRAQRLYGGGLRIHTTLRPDVQRAAEEAATRFVGADGDPEVAIAVIEPSTGEIVAAVGGRDYETRQFDLATQGRRQPGSAFKPFVLTAAVADGYLPSTPVRGDEGTLAWGEDDRERYRVRNYGRSNPGWITLAEATRSSVNGAFVRLILDVGIEDTIVAARALGITSSLNEHPSIALGGLTQGVTPLEMAVAYGTLANHGTRMPTSPIDRIEDADGNVVWRPDRTPKRTVDPAATWLVTEMLHDVVENGTGARARLPGWDVAGKTGTTSDHTDAWFVGYTPTLSAAVWMGYPDRRIPMRGVAGERVVTGGSWPARIWRELMDAALADRAPQTFEMPDEIAVEVEIDPETGMLAAEWCPGEVRVLPRPLVPEETCPSPPPTPTPTPTPTPDPDDGPTPSPSPSPTEEASPTPSPTPTGDADDDDEDDGD